MTATGPGPTPSPPRCAVCGTLVSGRFCPGCGAPGAAVSCGSCGTTLSPAARFCHRCGWSLGAAPVDAGRVRRAWTAAGVLVAASVLIGAYLLSSPPTPQAAAPPPAGAGPAMLAGPAPDISSMSPRQRFDRLYQRVMDAAASGDTAALVQFTQHAITAYTQLDSVDPDARYHLAILFAQVGEFPPALALADSILGADPTHLLGLLALGTVAELAGDRASLERVQRRFLDAWDQEQARGRVEYLDHRDALDEFRRAAETAHPAGRPSP